MIAPTQSLPRERPRPVWRLAKQSDPAHVRRLRDALGVHPVLASLLVGRGVRTESEARELLSPDLAGLHDPFTMAGMDRAVERLIEALRNREMIAVYGDYDVDGVTSTALLVSFLRSSGAEVIPYIPRRLVEGYGLNMEAVEDLAARGARLMVTCDCGVTAVDEVERARSLGMDVLIVDHHKVPARPPQAVAILDPDRHDCEYPFGELAAVGVTFKLLMALRRRLRESGYFSNGSTAEPNLRKMLDLVAMGTICDVVPLTGENRTLASIGLKVLAEDRRVGLQALRAASGVEHGPIGAGQVAFRLGPRINAAGRLDDARAGLDLILCEEPYEASRLARRLDSANAQRQEIEQEILEEALALAARKDPDERGLMLASEGWHPGVVGIVASRVAERFRRPTLVLAREDGVLRGSGRSVGRFHLYEALSSCAAHLTRFGGHGAAAGLELAAADRRDFEAAFLSYCRKRVVDEDLREVLNAALELDPSMVDEEVCEAVEMMAPYGAGNPTPVFIARGVRFDSSRLIGSDGRHVKGRVAGRDTIGFGLAERAREIGRAPMDIAYTVGFNTWRGERRLQLVLKDMLPEGAAGITVL